MSKSNDYKIAIVGPEDTVSGFKALGVDSFGANNAQEALEQLRKIKDSTILPTSTEKYAVVCIIEDLVAEVDQTEYAKLVEGPLPAVVILPGAKGSSGFAIERLRSLAERAIGASVI